MTTLPQPLPIATPVSRRGKTTHTAIVLTLALLTRLFAVGYTLVKLPRGFLYTRGIEMDKLARSLLAGSGLSSPFGAPTGPTAMIAPAYPIFVAGVFRLFGIHSIASSVVILGIQLTLNLVTVLLILHLGRRVAGEFYAVLAAAFWACSPAVFFMPTIFWETSFSTCFLLGLVAVALDLDCHSARSRWVANGAACGIAGLFNPALLPTLLTVGGWTAFRAGRVAMPKTLLACVTFVVVFSPWPLRNAHVFHAFIPTRTTVGFELWMGNRDGATGFLDQSVFPTFNPAELADYRRQGELQYFKQKQTLAKSYILTHKARFVALSLIRLKRFWSGTGSSNGSLFFALHALTTTALGLLGLTMLFRAWHWRVAMAFLIPLALFPLPYYITHAEFRYRLVVDPLLCVLAAYALDHLATQSQVRPLR